MIGCPCQRVWGHAVCSIALLLLSHSMGRTMVHLSHSILAPFLLCLLPTLFSVRACRQRCTVCLSQLLWNILTGSSWNILTGSSSKGRILSGARMRVFEYTTISFLSFFLVFCESPTTCVFPHPPPGAVQLVEPYTSTPDLLP